MVRWVMLTTHRYRALEFLWKRNKPVFLDRDQRDTSRIREILAILEQGQVVALFPEGSLQREHRDLQPFQGGLGLIARKSQASIVPIWIDGTPRKRHIFWHFATPSHSTVIFGEPYKADPTWSNEQVVQDLRRRMLELAATTRQSPVSHVVSS
jgi:1-acyl-sn-glycerol-3-phosphate acyltransferase